MKGVSSKTIVFITGAFVSHVSWDEWRTYFGSKGFTTHAPPWPHKEALPGELRSLHPTGNPGLSALTFAAVVDSYIQYINNLPGKPIVIGHSTGGLIVQLLVNRDLVTAGVAIHSLPPMGVIPYEWSFLRAGWRALGFGSQKKTYLMSFKKWQYAFVNGMSLNEQREAYDKNAAPESKRIAREAVGRSAKVDFKKKHVPLLLTSGDRDHLIPASLNRRNFGRYAQNNGSVTEYKDFPGRNHYVLGQSTWKEDADYILEWLSRLR